jgi:hypothetical protein
MSGELAEKWRQKGGEESYIVTTLHDYNITRETK